MQIGYPKSKQLCKNKAINPKKMSKADFIYYEQIILDIGVCQLCGDCQLDKPHHAKWGNFGADKDDRSIMCICVKCHRKIHHQGDSDNLREMAINFGQINWQEAPSWLREKYKG